MITDGGSVDKGGVVEKPEVVALMRIHPKTVAREVVMGNTRISRCQVELGEEEFLRRGYSRRGR